MGFCEIFIFTLKILPIKCFQHKCDLICAIHAHLSPHNLLVCEALIFSIAKMCDDHGLSSYKYYNDASSNTWFAHIMFYNNDCNIVHVFELALLHFYLCLKYMFHMLYKFLFL
jgi:hypothetical protein